MASTRWKLTGAGLAARVSQWTQRSFIKRIQRGTINMGTNASATATITAVDLLNTKLRFLGYDTDSAGGTFPNVTEVRLALTNATTITATRSSAASTPIVSYEVTEFVPGVIRSIQRGSILVTGAAVANTATITAVVSAKAELEFLGWETTETTFDSRAWAYLVLTSDTVVTATRVGGANDVTVGFQVVEWL